MNNQEEIRNNLFNGKNFIYDRDCQKSFLKGTEAVAKTVGVTMGARGRLVHFMDMGHLWVRGTKDGVSVAWHVRLKDVPSNFGAEKVLEAAEKQREETGDGTTLTCVLTNAIFSLGYKAIKRGFNTKRVIDCIEEDIIRVVKRIEFDAKKCDTQKEMENVATISANNNRELGALIAEAVFRAGDHGIVNYSPSKTEKTYLEFSDGYQYNCGVNDINFIDQRKGRFEVDNSYVVVVDDIIGHSVELLSIFRCLKNHLNLGDEEPLPPITIFAKEVKDEALGALIKARSTGLQSAYIPVGGLPKEQMHRMQDIAAMTGAKVIGGQSGVRLKDITFEMLGITKNIKSTIKETTIEKKEDIEYTARIEYLKSINDDKDSSNHDIELASTSLSKLTSGMSNIRVGGKTESEQKEIIDRVEDAILATKSAKELGVIDGGGVGILKALKELNPKFTSSLFFTPKQIVYKALHSPIETILKNAHIRPNHIIKKIKRDGHGGFDIDNGTTSLFSMSSKGIIDPAKVVIQAIKNASSAACSMLNTGSIIYND